MEIRSRFRLKKALAGGLPAALLALGAGATWAAESGPVARPALLNRTAAKLQDDSPRNLCQFAGRVLLVVNTASKCGYTPQYEALEKLRARHAARGLIDRSDKVVAAFPSATDPLDARVTRQIETLLGR